MDLDKFEEARQRAIAMLQSPEALSLTTSELANAGNLIAAVMQKLGVGVSFGNLCAHRYEREHWRNGILLAEDDAWNVTTNVGLDEILDKVWKGSSYTAAHYVGLTDGTPTVAAGDTMSSHAGWAEVTDYSEGTRETLTLGSVSSQSVDNSASKASFSINGTATSGGAFITTDNTKSGTSGILMGVAAFTGGDRSLQSGDTLNVTATLTQASA